jgi:hypothetical protein
LGFFIIFSFSHDDDAFEEWLEQKILLHIEFSFFFVDYDNGDLFVFLFILCWLMIDPTSDDFEDSNGTDERWLLDVIEGNDDKRDDDSFDDDEENNDENDRASWQ